jgi:glycosyltransferase involved in cell wall biosynthesis
MEPRKLIIIPVHNQEKKIQKNLALLEDLNTDILMVDDGSTDNTCNIIKDNAWLKYIKHEINLGIGAAIITGYEYARDLEYEVIILLDLNNSQFREELSQLMENILYGYDIVSSSRILENFNYQEIPQNLIEMTSELASHIRDITDYDITDPLSGIKALRIEALHDMELTEFNHGLFLQLWIQAHYFGLAVIEIPARSGAGFGDELKMYENPVELFLSLIETEKFLYAKKNLN